MRGSLVRRHARRTLLWDQGRPHKRIGRPVFGPDRRLTVLGDAPEAKKPGPDQIAMWPHASPDRPALIEHDEAAQVMRFVWPPNAGRDRFRFTCHGHPSGNRDEAHLIEKQPVGRTYADPVLGERWRVPYRPDVKAPIGLPVLLQPGLVVESGATS